MILSQPSAQSVASLSGPAETETKRIVPHRGSATGFDPPRSRPEAEPRLLKKIQLKENITSYLKAAGMGQVIGRLSPPYHKLSPSIRLVLTGQGCVGEMLPGVSQRSPQARRPVAGDPENLRLQSGRSGDFLFPLAVAFISLESSEGVSQGTRRYLPGSRRCRRSGAASPGLSQRFRGPDCERWRAT